MANYATKKKGVKVTDLSDVLAEEGTASVDLQDVTAGAVSIPDSTLINVKSNVFGGLKFVCRKTGETIEWSRCGEVQQMSIMTLRAMKMEAIRFFKDQWIVLIGFADRMVPYKIADVYKDLFIAQFYRNLIEPSNYEDICAWTPDEIRAKLPLMSDGARENLAVALNVYIEKGVLDSVRAIKAFEEVLGCELRTPD